MARFAVLVTWLAFSTSAFAADMAVKAPPLPPAPVNSWTGFYVGGDIGWADLRQNGTTLASPPGFGPPPVGGAGVIGLGLAPTDQSLDSRSGLGGIYTGYNWQTGNWVLGIEADINWLRRNSSNAQNLIETCCANAPTGPMQLTATNDWLASARGRVGILANSNWLLYITGGAAWTKTSYGASATVQAGPTANAAFSRIDTGVALGAGGEWMFAPHWIARLEYLYYQFHGASGNAPLVGATGSCTTVCSFNVNFSDLKINTVRGGLSYKF